MPFHYYKEVFSLELVQELIDKGYAVDGRSGGLVLGRFHNEGGVYFLVSYGNCYKLAGEMEGYEYIFNPAITYLTRNSIKDMNNIIRDENLPFVEYSPGDHIRTIDARLPESVSYGAKYILLDGRGYHFVINKHSTKRNLENLNAANIKFACEYNSPIDQRSGSFNIRDLQKDEIIEKVHFLEYDHW